MFARKVSMHLKGSVPEFTQTLEREVHSPASKTEGIPGRNHICRTGRKGSIWY